MRVQRTRTHPRACVHACSEKRDSRTHSFYFSLALYLLYDDILCPLSLPLLHSSDVFPLIRSVLVAQSSVHSRSQEEADRLSQTFFFRALFFSRPSLMKSYDEQRDMKSNLFPKVNARKRRKVLLSRKGQF